MDNGLIQLIIGSLVSGFIGSMISIFPLWRAIKKRQEKAEKNLQDRQEFQLRRERISDEAIHSAMKIIFWIRKGCKIHDSQAWNGELDKSVVLFEEVEKKLVDLNQEIVDTYRQEHK